MQVSEAKLAKAESDSECLAQATAAASAGSKARGRPPAFNREQALDKALEVFWRRGYEGASLSELTDALGINRPSLYAAFGNKEDLFHKVLERYLQGPVAYATAALQEPTARRVVEKFLSDSVQLLTNTGSPRGCMIVQAALTCGESGEAVSRMLVDYRNHFQNALCLRLERAKLEGDLHTVKNKTVPAASVGDVVEPDVVESKSAKTAEPKSVESTPAELARYIATVHQGLSVQASSGATREELMRVVAMVMQHWPSD